jgi:hypothetical protein
MSKEMVLLKRRLAIEAIQRNPITITITRTKSIRAGGGHSIDVTTHGPYTVRLFNRHNMIPDEIAGLAGKKSVDQSWAILADSRADLQHDNDTVDTFTVDGIGNFQITKVVAHRQDGLVTSINADCDKVG